MRSHRLKITYTALSVATVMLFYLIPYLTLSKVRNLELVMFWSLVTLVWLVVTNSLLMRDLL